MRTKLIYLLFFSAVLSSCIVFHSGNITSGPLLSANDRYIDIARGEAKCTNFLGIINVGSNTLLLDAKKDLYNNRPLNKNEYYSNFTADFTKSWVLGVILETKVVVSAEILHEADTLVSHPFTQTFKNLSNPDKSQGYFVSEKDTFYTNEIIYYSVIGQYYYEKRKIIAISGRNLNLKPIYSTEPNITIDLNNYEFYSTSKSYSGFTAGDSVNVEKFSLARRLDSTVPKKMRKGLVLALKADRALIATKSGKDNYPYNKLYKLK